jgi:hypothetical protein
VSSRHQVFVSSTYLDLRPEREKVIEALLLLDCFPAGMEIFPASNDSAWEAVKKIIAQCDYYVVVSAGKYGSIDVKSGKSFTEREYEYAKAQHIPTLVFIHGDLMALRGDLLEDTDEGKTRLGRFHDRLKNDHYVRHWTKADDLFAYVVADMTRLRGDEPRPGWVRAGSSNAAAEAEISALRAQVIDLQAQVERGRESRPPTSLAQGDDPFEVVFTQLERDPKTKQLDRTVHVAQLTWNEILSVLGPVMYTEESETKLRGRLAAEIKRMAGLGGLNAANLSRDSWDKIKLQLRTLGYIQPSGRRHPVHDIDKYWTLTPEGETELQAVAAIRRSDPEISGS